MTFSTKVPNTFTNFSLELKTQTFATLPPILLFGTHTPPPWPIPPRCSPWLGAKSCRHPGGTRVLQAREAWRGEPASNSFYRGLASTQAVEEKA